MLPWAAKVVSVSLAKRQGACFGRIPVSCLGQLATKSVKQSATKHPARRKQIVAIGQSLCVNYDFVATTSFITLQAFLFDFQTAFVPYVIIIIVIIKDFICEIVVVKSFVADIKTAFALKFMERFINLSFIILFTIIGYCIGQSEAVVGPRFACAKETFMDWTEHCITA